MTTRICYSIFPRNPEAHLFEVRCTVAEPDPAGQTFSLPTWIPGSYLIREFAKNVIRIRASSGRKLQSIVLSKMSLAGAGDVAWSKAHDAEPVPNPGAMEPPTHRKAG